MPNHPPYPDELRERAVRLVLDHQDEYGSQWEAICSVAENKSSLAVPPYEVAQELVQRIGHSPRAAPDLALNEGVAVAFADQDVSLAAAVEESLYDCAGKKSASGPSLQWRALRAGQWLWTSGPSPARTVLAEPARTPAGRLRMHGPVDFRAGGHHLAHDYDRVPFIQRQHTIATYGCGSAPSPGDRLGWQSCCDCHRV